MRGFKTSGPKTTGSKTQVTTSSPISTEVKTQIQGYSDLETQRQLATRYAALTAATQASIKKSLDDAAAAGRSIVELEFAYREAEQVALAAKKAEQLEDARANEFKKLLIIAIDKDLAQAMLQQAGQTIGVPSHSGENPSGGTSSVGTGPSGPGGSGGSGQRSGGDQGGDGTGGDGPGRPDTTLSVRRALGLGIAINNMRYLLGEAQTRLNARRDELLLRHGDERTAAANDTLADIIMHIAAQNANDPVLVPLRAGNLHDPAVQNVPGVAAVREELADAATAVGRVRAAAASLNAIITVLLEQWRRLLEGNPGTNAVNERVTAAMGLTIFLGQELMEAFDTVGGAGPELQAIGDRLAREEQYMFPDDFYRPKTDMYSKFDKPGRF